MHIGLDFLMPSCCCHARSFSPALTDVALTAQRGHLSPVPLDSISVTGQRQQPVGIACGEANVTRILPLSRAARSLQPRERGAKLDNVPRAKTEPSGCSLDNNDDCTMMTVPPRLRLHSRTHIACRYISYHEYDGDGRVRSFACSFPRCSRPWYYRSMAQWTVLVVSREPFVEAARVEGMAALKAANLRIVDKVIQTYGAVMRSASV
jgi:hypothetical protein